MGSVAGEVAIVEVGAISRVTGFLPADERLLIRLFEELFLSNKAKRVRFRELVPFHERGLALSVIYRVSVVVVAKRVDELAIEGHGRCSHPARPLSHHNGWVLLSLRPREPSLGLLVLEADRRSFSVELHGLLLQLLEWHVRASCIAEIEFRFEEQKVCEGALCLIRRILDLPFLASVLAFVNPEVLVANISLGSCEAVIGAPGVVEVAVAGELIRGCLPVRSFVEGAAVLESRIAVYGRMRKSF